MVGENIQKGFKIVVTDVTGHRNKTKRTNRKNQKFNSKFGNAGNVKQSILIAPKAVESCSNLVSDQWTSTECCICDETMLASDLSWFCTCCHVVLHFECIKEWVTHSLTNSQWKCPICRYEYLNKPIDSCYCGKNAISHLKIVKDFYSCEEACGRRRRDPCPHPCTIPCHPGNCPPCVSMLERKCFCGSETVMDRCSRLKKEDLLFSCVKICNGLLNCKSHRCEKRCHESPCSPCEVCKSSIRCYCGKHEKTFYQGITKQLYSCGNMCEKLLDCKNHKCKQYCHEGKCKPCEYDPSILKSCPCGKTSLDKNSACARTSCLDPVPSCRNICAKTLDSCNANGMSHTCKSICHQGPCPPCNELAQFVCTCGKKTKSFLCSSLEGLQFKCNAPCKLKLSCGKHKCRQKCCNPFIVSHACVLACNQPYPCRKHNCTKLCHPKGECGPCDVYLNISKICMCGTVKIQPPILCSSVLKFCTNVCPQASSCGHKNRHFCHFEDEPCFPCKERVTKLCNCGKTEVENVECYVNVKCDQICKKLLNCATPEYPHFCQRICHSGECNEYDLQKGIVEVSDGFSLEDGTVICKQLCQQMRKCGHFCNAICHGKTSCPTNVCKQMILKTCTCGLRKEYEMCTESKTNLSEYLKCDDDCYITKRNKSFAEALNINLNSLINGFLTRNSYDKDAPIYNHFLLESVTLHKELVVKAEKILGDAVSKLAFVSSRSTVHKEARTSDGYEKERTELWLRILNQLSDFYGCTVELTVSAIKIKATKGFSCKPVKLLSQMSFYNSK